MKRLIAIATLLVAALGSVDAVLLTLLKVEDAVTGRADSAFCSAVSATGCSIALQSPVSSVLGIPVSVFALAAYLTLLGLTIARLVGSESPTGQAARPATTLIAYGAALWSVGLAAYSASQSSWCPYCIGLYAVNALLLVMVRLDAGPWPGWSPLKALRELASRPGSWLKITVGFALLVGCTQAVIAWRIAGGLTARQASDAARLEASLKLGTVPMEFDAVPTEGPEGAPLQIVKFSDLQCPHCRNYFETLMRIRKEAPDSVRVGFRHYPLDSECNPFVGRSVHPHACAAARTAICAQSQGLSFFEFVGKVFEHQADLEPADLDTLASEAGLDLAALHACAQSPTTRDLLLRDILVARAYGVESTPSSLVRGLLFSGGFRPESFRFLSEHLAEGAAEARPAPEPVLDALRDGFTRPALPARVPDRLLTRGRDNAPVLQLRVRADAGAEGLEPLKAALELASVFPEMATIVPRLEAPADCSREASRGGCARTRRLACAWSLHIDLTLARALLEEPAPSLAKLAELSPGLDACAAGGLPDRVLAEDSAELAEWGGADLVVDGHPIRSLRPNAAILERAVAVSRLQRLGFDTNGKKAAKNAH